MGVGVTALGRVGVVTSCNLIHLVRHHGHASAASDLGTAPEKVVSGGWWVVRGEE